jgi:hypothetical protein
MSRIGFGYGNLTTAHQSSHKWYPYNKGGSQRKWYGNNEFVIAFDPSSYDILSRQGNKLPSRQYYFKPSVTWAGISGGDFSVRICEAGFIFDGTGSCLFRRDRYSLEYFNALLNSTSASYLLKIISPTISFEVGHIKRIPVPSADVGRAEDLARQALAISRDDWDDFEISWDFKSLQWLKISNKNDSIGASWTSWELVTGARIEKMRRLETENNRVFIDAYGLQDEISPEVPEDQITLARADREKDCQRLISYAVGCMMGRYSLDEPGLIYAHAGNVGFDSSRYEKTFPADADGIVPITDESWFEDDAAIRVREFVRRLGRQHTGRKHGVAGREPGHQGQRNGG